MMKYVILLMVGLPLVMSGCVKDEKDKTGQRSEAEPVTGGIISFIQKQKMVDYQERTIGEAFDSYKYVAVKEWKMASLPDGFVTVDFSGWSDDALDAKDKKAGIVSRGISATFVIQPDGSFYLAKATQIERLSGGKVRHEKALDIAAFLNAVYANKRIDP